MSAKTITCPNGHSNSATQKFCGDCGLSLAGLCPNGHQNSDDQRFCGECGAPLPGREDAVGLTANPLTDSSKQAGWYRDPADPASEVFYNGVAWTTQRRPLGGPPFGPPVGGSLPFTPSPGGGGALPPRVGGSSPTPPTEPVASPLPPPTGDATATAKAGSVLGGFWGGLPKWRKVAAVAVPALVLLLVLVGGRRDEKSYDYGQTEVVGWAFPLWEGAVTTQAVPNIKTERDACRFVVENARDFVTPQEMLHLDDSDIIDGCADKLTSMSKQAGLRR